jgi:hypothetical protein
MLMKSDMPPSMPAGIALPCEDAHIIRIWTGSSLRACIQGHSCELEDALDDAGETQSIANEFALWPGAFRGQKEFALSERVSVQMMSRISTVFICRNA